MNIYQKLNQVRKKIDYIKKDKTVQNYKAVTHDQVTAMVRDHLVSVGIVIYPNLISSVTVDTGSKTSSGTTMIRVEAVYEFTVVNTDDGADSFKTSVSAHANDTGDKAPGKALSYAKKALVLKLFEIETGEDDESRYQSFDLESWLEAIKTSKDLPELQQLYNDATSAALTAKDQNARRLIVDEKDKRKAELA